MPSFPSGPVEHNLHMHSGLSPYKLVGLEPFHKEYKKSLLPCAVCHIRHNASGNPLSIIEFQFFIKIYGTQRIFAQLYIQLECKNWQTPHNNYSSMILQPHSWYSEEVRHHALFKYVLPKGWVPSLCWSDNYLPLQTFILLPTGRGNLPTVINILNTKDA